MAGAPGFQKLPVFPELGASHPRWEHRRSGPAFARCDPGPARAAGGGVEFRGPAVQHGRRGSQAQHPSRNRWGWPRHSEPGPSGHLPALGRVPFSSGCGPACLTGGGYGRVGAGCTLQGGPVLLHTWRSTEHLDRETPALGSARRELGPGPVGKVGRVARPPGRWREVAMAPGCPRGGLLLRLLHSCGLWAPSSQGSPCPGLCPGWVVMSLRQCGSPCGLGARQGPAGQAEWAVRHPGGKNQPPPGAESWPCRGHTGKLWGCHLLRSLVLECATCGSSPTEGH